MVVSVAFSKNEIGTACVPVPPGQIIYHFVLQILDNTFLFNLLLWHKISSLLF